MDYIQVRVKIEPYSAGISEMLMASLEGMGVEGFIEEDPYLLAFISEKRFHKRELETWLGRISIEGILIKTEFVALPSRNWNEVWENSYKAIVVEGICAVRAPFHDVIPNLLNIVIEPKMSFGTGHHETTQLMIRHMAATDLKKMKILDMGCGTGILGIFALLQGADYVTAIDVDEWAYNNSLENFRRNTVENDSFSVVLGDAYSIPSDGYNVILANINRNILMEDMPTYFNHLKDKGILLLSGILESDKEVIRRKAISTGLSFVSELYDNSWISIKFSK